MHIDFFSYPEQTSDCCLLLSQSAADRLAHFDIQTKSKEPLRRPVAITIATQEADAKVLRSVETSVWTITDRTIDALKLGTYREEKLRVCVHAKKEASEKTKQKMNKTKKPRLYFKMPTLRIALRIPITIATLVVLVCPVIGGDLRTQIFIKLVALLLQTVCFLFLCSIAPVNGFSNTKPKICKFYFLVA